MLKRAGVAVVLIIAWTTVVVAGTLYGWWRRPLAPPEDPRAFMQAAIPLVDDANRANTALVLIENGAIAAEHYSAHAGAIDANTVFATASLSKWITAHAVMKLAEQGKLDLDQPVERYLTRWHLPVDSFRSQDVTARRLLSHMAGLTDDLGFGDYRRDETLPTLEEALSAPRSAAGAVSRIAVGIAPGTEFRYSGGGYLLLELLVEELAGESFESFVIREILQPLGMTRSGYADLSAMQNTAGSYDADGRPAPIYRYASRAATGFTASAGEMVKFVLAHLRPGPGSLLTPATLASMRRAEAKTMGVDLWGLGTVLYAPTERGDAVFGHDGVNDPAISATVRINPDTQDAIIVLATGSKTLASQLGAEWVFWQTGLPDVLTIPAEVRSVWPVLGIGVCGILLLVLVPGWRRGK
ncbi:MAG: beta-lactamase family protein [Gemmatimonadetes bacterium]|nr:beta-lactamase family protein [Gemmatimonadota bacterium]